MALTLHDALSAIPKSHLEPLLHEYVILYFGQKAHDRKDLCESVEYKNPTLFKQRILADLHKRKLIEYDSKKEEVLILPPGIKYVEDLLLQS
jgi:hypothetical protein